MSEEKNKRKRAAAISYDPKEHDAPLLAAFGEGYVAEKIIEIAKASGVPVMPDPSIASLLSKVSIGDEIPPEMYEAVAKVLAFVGEIDRRYGEKIKGIR
ncbi:MAG: EscU/YscU/HrcU family type III secretion system export apparatus switch protein [Oscillospiraceae bacterium]|nr:EscU/YscU/HrcU family type III secretion system export apparatus switch protein [Oscillospiraceae bacterium]